jgi:transcriptional regulator with XRE-family HTH domain
MNRKELTAKQIQRWRQDRGLSQKQLAALLGVNDLTVSRWERDVQSAPYFLKLALESLSRTLNSKNVTG